MSSSPCDAPSDTTFTSHDKDGSLSLTKDELCTESDADYYGQCGNGGFYSAFFPTNGGSFDNAMCIYDGNGDALLTRQEYLCAFVFDYGATAAADPAQLHANCCPLAENAERRSCCINNPPAWHGNCTLLGTNATGTGLAGLLTSPSPPMPPSAPAPAPEVPPITGGVVAGMILGALGAFVLTVACYCCRKHYRKHLHEEARRAHQAAEEAELQGRSRDSLNLVEKMKKSLSKQGAVGADRNAMLRALQAGPSRLSQWRAGRFSRASRSSTARESVNVELDNVEA